jgi:hypothetical protein
MGLRYRRSVLLSLASAVAAATAIAAGRPMIRGLWLIEALLATQILRGAFVAGLKPASSSIRFR